MKTAPLLLSSTLLGGLAGFFAGRLDSTDAPRAAANEALERERAGDEQRFAALEESRRELETRLASLSAQLELAAPAPEREPQLDLERLVADAVDARLRALEGTAATNGTVLAPAPLDVAAIGSELLTGELSWEERRALWKELQDEGRDGELRAWLEERVRQYPDDVEAHVRLAEAFTQKLMTTTDMMAQGALAMKVDATLDQALALDDHHWEARFNKAVSLSFWPPNLGKQGEAIRNFEVLLDQQRTQPKKPEHAQTYLFLGNMHSQRGDIDKALAVWREGLVLFPGDSELTSRIANAGGN